MTLLEQDGQETATPKRRAGAGRWGFVFRIAASALLLAYVFPKFQWADLWGHLRTASPAWLLGSLLFYGMAPLLGGVRWWLLLAVQNVRIRVLKVVAITAIGQFFNAFLLGSTGGDVVRVLYVIREAPHSKKRAGLTILLDRAMGLFILAVVALFMVAMQPELFMGRAELRRIVWALSAIVLACMAGGGALMWLPVSGLAARLRLPARTAGFAIALQEGARRYLEAYRLTAAATAISFLIHLLCFTGAYCAARALRLPLGYVPVSVILATAAFVMAVPVTVSGHGLRESIFILMFSLFGIGAPAAVAYSICYLGVSVVTSLLCGIVYVGYRREAPRALAVAAEP